LPYGTRSFDPGHNSDLLNNLKKPAEPASSFMKQGLAAAGTAAVAGGLPANGVKLLGQTKGPLHPETPRF
jgi:hypothetical protein